MNKGWYVVHTYSGYEQKIERIITKMMEQDQDFAKYCTAVMVPMELVKVKKGPNEEEKEEKKKILPGYLLVELELQPDSWLNTTAKIARIQGVTGFLGADKSGKNPPRPLSPREHKEILERTGAVPQERTFKPKQDFVKGEEVKITQGPFASFTGTIDEIDLIKGILRLSVQIFGRPTMVTVDFTQVEKLVF